MWALIEHIVAFPIAMTHVHHKWVILKHMSDDGATKGKTPVTSDTPSPRDEVRHSGLYRHPLVYYTFSWTCPLFDDEGHLLQLHTEPWCGVLVDRLQESTEGPSLHYWSYWCEWWRATACSSAC